MFPKPWKMFPKSGGNLEEGLSILEMVRSSGMVREDTLLEYSKKQQQ
jgi:hypothetical protein